jgi:hypothetical protein
LGCPAVGCRLCEADGACSAPPHWSHVILDGTLFATDRLAETTTSVRR